jgi:hypothetical protein
MCLKIRLSKRRIIITECFELKNVEQTHDDDIWFTRLQKRWNTIRATKSKFESFILICLLSFYLQMWCSSNEKKASNERYTKSWFATRQHEIIWADKIFEYCADIFDSFDLVLFLYLKYMRLCTYFFAKSMCDIVLKKICRCRKISSVLMFFVFSRIEYSST